MESSEIIKACIKRYGYNIKLVAEKININRVTLSNQINGNPTLSSLERISEVLGCPVRELLTYRKDVPKEYESYISKSNNLIKPVNFFQQLASHILAELWYINQDLKNINWKEVSLTFIKENKFFVTENNYQDNDIICSINYLKKDFKA